MRTSGETSEEDTLTARFRRGAYMVVAGRLSSPCGIEPTLDLFVPNDVEPATVVTSSLTNLQIDTAGLTTLSLGASYDRILPTLTFDNDSYYSWANLETFRDKAELDGSFKRFIFSNEDAADGTLIAQAACELAIRYGITEYGASMYDTTLCARDNGAACISDTQCISGSKR